MIQNVIRNLLGRVYAIAVSYAELQLEYPRTRCVSQVATLFHESRPKGRLQILSIDAEEAIYTGFAFEPLIPEQRKLRYWLVETPPALVSIYSSQAFRPAGLDFIRCSLCW